MEKTPPEAVDTSPRRNTKQKLLKYGRPLAALLLVGGIAGGAQAVADAEGQPSVFDRVATTGNRPNRSQASREYKPTVDPSLIVKAQEEQHKKNIEILNAAIERQRLLRTPGAVVDGRIVYDAPLWYTLHQCEQAETWHAGGHFGNGLLSGGNGLGMSADAWRLAVEAGARRGVTLPATGWEANIDQQMQAAQVFLADEGWGWACQPWE